MFSRSSASRPLLSEFARALPRAGDTPPPSKKPQQLWALLLALWLVQLVALSSALAQPSPGGGSLTQSPPEDAGPQTHVAAQPESSPAAQSATAQAPRPKPEATTELAPGDDAGTSIEPAPDAGPFPFLAPRAAPPDIAAFPKRPGGKATPTEPGLELHGYVTGWFTPWSQPSPVRARDTFRLRFAVLRVDARPAKNVHVIARLGLMLPTSPLLDFALTYTPHAAFGVTLGQFRLPIGAAATTLAPQLVLLDRPSYVYALTPLAFRDVGVMVHSGPHGLANGLFHYRLAMTSGAGRAGVGTSRPPDDLAKTLVAARVMVDLGRLVSAAGSDRLVLGGSYVRSNDPAIATGDAARDAQLAVNVLGRSLAPIGLARITQLSGADLTFNYGPVYVQAELLYLRSVAHDHSVSREGMGSNLDLAYTLPMRPWNALGLQLAGRLEQFNPRFDEAKDSLPNDEVQVVMLGINVLGGAVRTSIFGSLVFFEDQATRNKERAAEITLRAASVF